MGIRSVLFLTLLCLLKDYIHMLQISDGTTDFCKENTLPTVNVTCTSCQGICGKMTVLRNIHCSCDSACSVYNDCCPDFEQFCPALYNKSTEAAKKYKNVEVTCKRYNKNVELTSFVTSCPTNKSACDVKTVFDVIPVTDLDTGVEFVNGKCAACNGVTNGSVWDTTLYCTSPDTIATNVTETSNNSTAISTKGLLQSLNTDCMFRVNFQLPSVHPLRQCVRKFIDPCEHCGNVALKEQCQHGPIQIVNFIASGTFRNIYCAICLDQEKHNYVRCGPGILDPSEREFFPEFSLAVIFDFNTNGEVQIRADPENCPIGTTWINEIVGCKNIECGPDFKLHVDNCVLVWSKFQFMITLSVLFESNITTDKEPAFAIYANEQIQYFIQMETKYVNSSTDIKEMGLSIHVDQYGNFYDIKFDFDFKLNTYLKSHDVITNSTKDIVMTAINGIYFHSKFWFENYTGIQAFTVFADNTSELLTYSNLNCPQILLNEEEYILLPNRSILLLKNVLLLKEGNYIRNNSKVYVCKSKIIDSTESFGIHSITGLITIILMALSEICIIMRLILQPILPVFATFPLKLQFHMCIAMFIAFGLFLISPLFNEWFSLCKTVAIFLHWAFLSLFCWTTIISIDTWDSFRGFGMKNKYRNSGFKGLLRYILLGWGIPLVWVICGIMLDEINVEGSFKPNYGSYRCWINQPEALLALFAAPFGVCVLLNAIFYSLTACNLRKAFNDRNKIHKENERHFGLYVKLFILMGITWTFGFIAPFVDHISLWIIFISLNASQGIFIFIAFVCTKQVYSSFINLTKRQGHSQDSSESRHIRTTTKTAVTLAGSTGTFTDLAASDTKMSTYS